MYAQNEVFGLYISCLYLQSMKRNVPMLGFILGVIMPIIGVFLVYLVKFSEYNLSYYFDILYGNSKVASMVLTLSIILNLIPFLYYTNKRLDYTARGVLVATILYAVLIVLIKFVW